MRPTCLNRTTSFIQMILTGRDARSGRMSAAPTRATRSSRIRAAIAPRMTDAHQLIGGGASSAPPLFDPGVLRRVDRRARDTARDAGRWPARGVHFFCVNASLKSQFEFVQQTWANNPRFGGLNDNMDPLTSSPCDEKTASRMTIARRGAPAAGAGALRTQVLPRFVTVKAGAYLFLPSLTALRFLGRAAADT